MQTFLPWPESERSAKALDNKRLNKQRHEGLQILQALADTGEGYPLAMKSHPAVLMWAGHERALGRYLYAICHEWTERGYHDRVEMQIIELIGKHFADGVYEEPSWVGLDVFHENHRLRLWQKDPSFYSLDDFGPVTPMPGNLWPITKRGNWVYMNEGKIVSRMKETPVYRSATENKMQCTFCNFWWNIDYLVGGRCPHCVEQAESIDLWFDLHTDKHDDMRKLSKELLDSISQIIHLKRSGRL